MPNRVAFSLGAIALAIVTACDRSADTAQTQGTDSAAAATAVPLDSLSVTGLITPESVLYDQAGDVYLVANINGDPLGKDDNGFISKIAPDGTMQQLKWIDGAAASIRLNAPKGMAIIADTLFVADIDSVRAFSRTTGEPLRARPVPGSTFLNDLAASDGVLYVSDSGLKPDFSTSGTDAVYRFDNGKAVAVVRDTALHGPNGLAVTPEGLIIVPYGSKTIWRVPVTGGSKVAFAQMPAGMMDGVVRVNDGSLLVSSWETKTIYRVDAQGQAQPLLQNVEAPADIGYDTQRNRVLIPLFTQNRVEIRGLR